MNRKQRACIKVGFLLLVLVTLFPPWSFRYRSSYGFLFHPPFGGGATVNLTHLFVEWVLIALVTSGAFLLQNKEGSTTARQDDPLAALLGPDQKRTENRPPAKHARKWQREFTIPLIAAFTFCVIGLVYYGARRIARELPLTEDSKLGGMAYVSNYGQFVWKAYNGSDFVLTEVRVSISVFDEKGNAIISNRVYRVPASDFYPQQTKELSTEVGFTLGESQRWGWNVVGAKGRPE